MENTEEIKKKEEIEMGKVIPFTPIIRNKGQGSQYPFAYMQVGEYFEIEMNQSRLLMIAKRWAFRNRHYWAFTTTQLGNGIVRIRRVK